MRQIVGPEEARKWVHLAVDTLGQLLAAMVTPANEQGRAQVDELAAKIQEATGTSVEIAFVDQGYTGEQPPKDAERHGIRLEVVKLPTAKRGFVLLPRRWVVERSFAWMARFRRLARDYERLSKRSSGRISSPLSCQDSYRLCDRLHKATSMSTISETGSR